MIGQRSAGERTLQGAYWSTKLREAFSLRRSVSAARAASRVRAATFRRRRRCTTPWGFPLPRPVDPPPQNISLTRARARSYILTAAPVYYFVKLLSKFQGYPTPEWP
jgi:hypothetical protein